MHFHLPRVKSNKSIANLATQVLDAMKHYKHEHESEAHQIFRQAAGHSVKASLPQTINPVRSTGVIYCSDRAMANGFSYAAHTIDPNAPPRLTSIPLPTDSLEYAPTTGVKELRAAGKASQYTYEMLSRVAAVIGDVYTSYQVPDYTAYDQILSSFKRLVPKDIQTQGLQVILASNPRNPTGQVIKGNDLKELVGLGREGTTVILDEFYSWYIYPENEHDYGHSISSAEYVQDVNQDSVVIIDGLTKNWRLPGWRVCWVIGPKNLVTALSQSGSFLDGGANHPFQLAAIPLLDPAHVKIEKAFLSGDFSEALQRHFKAKRDHVLKRLHEMHLDVDIPPTSTFYIWLNLEKLPAPLNNGLTFFEELLKEQTIVIPGIFFDINPAHRRNLFSSPCHHFIRISFGPPLEDLDKGMDAFTRVLKKARKEGMKVFGHSYKKSVDEDVDTPHIA
ncbi:pyridoxal phosphate-dependent transferase [Mycena leptocephala]|nr:pyridoxal phosphate-dependent transferase [Mycena leptocephala]